MNATLLIELLTEELPPKALARLGEVFANQVHAALSGRALVAAEGGFRWYATPRRLAMEIPAVLAQAPDATAFEKIMPVSVALDAQGQPTPALTKKLAAKGIPLTEVVRFERRMDGKSETFFYESHVTGVKLDEVLADMVADALKKLPIPKVMRWGDTEYQFVRPVHGLVMLHGSRVVPGRLLGLTSGDSTLGHRFLSSGPIRLAGAEAYVSALENQGKVVVSFAERKARIAAQLDARARALGATLNPAEGLLDEVTALVEWPVVYVGEFEAEFLEVPQECLILTMQQNQKYFPLLDAQGRLMNKFLVVSNMAVADPVHIVTGNAKVVRPRLSDARFFYNQDRKQPLSTRLEKLGAVVYHNKLGSVLERVERVEALAGRIAARLGADVALASRTARLSKADLVTDMVGEFPELQGIMGRYYALHDGEPREVADGIQAHYLPRFAGDALPRGKVAAAVALADKLDALVGFFGIGQIPTGDKDPFGLRRATLGVLRILMETPLPLDVRELIGDAQAGFRPGVLQQPVLEPLLEFMYDRLRGSLRDGGHSQDAIEAVLAVLALGPVRIDRVPARLLAVREFLHLHESLALAAANKRIGNILKKAEGAIGVPQAALLQEPAERALFEALQVLAPQVVSHVEREAYGDALKAVAGVREAVDAFFDGVMVMADDPAVRGNRLALLKSLSESLNAVADISRLAV